MRRGVSWKVLTGAAFLGLGPAIGCHNGGEAERFGKTYYLDGAGNWGWGTKGVVEGLKAAGYTGDVEPYAWTTSFNPLVDQVIPLGPRLRAASLAGKIKRYHERYPDAKINMVGLSAGTAIALWAIEGLPADVKVHNVVLLGASISHDYDVREALTHMTGRIFVYHSAQDGFLTGVPVLGTMDGKRGVAPAGRTGLTPPPEFEDRVVNIGWSPEWTAMGWDGSHLAQAGAVFVENQVSRHIIEPGQRFAARPVVAPAAATAPAQPQPSRARSFPEAALFSSGGPRMDSGPRGQSATP